MPAELDWTIAETGIYDWIKAALGALELRWSGEDAAAPAGDFGNLVLTSVLPVGMPSQVISYDAARDATHQGIQLSAGGPAELVLTVSAFTREASGNASAVALLAKARNKLAIADSDERGALRAAGVTVRELGAVTGLPELQGSDFRGRAALELRLYVQDYASVFTTWIETYEATGTYEP